MGTSSGAYKLNHDCTSPICCTSFLESVCWQDVVWLTVPWDPNKKNGSMNVFKYF